MSERKTPRPIDPVDRAHLTGLTRPSPPIHRYAPSAHLVDLVERYWVPVGSVSEPSTQTTLQHPVCLIVVSDTYARFYGVTRGRSSVTLDGDGWAVGTMSTWATSRRSTASGWSGPSAAPCQQTRPTPGPTARRWRRSSPFSRRSSPWTRPG